MRARRHALRQVVLAVAIVALAIVWVRLAIRPSTDLLNHREFGRRFAAGEFLYAGGLDYPYLPTWAAAHAPLAAVPAGAASAIVVPIGVAALITIMFVLRRLARHHGAPPDAEIEFWVAAAALVLVSRFVIRDLLDGGENLIITAMVWGALWTWSLGRLKTGAALLGGAIALKLTAAVFILVLVVRGRYRQAAVTTALAAALVALPAVWMGAASYRTHLQWWSTALMRGIGSGDPTVGVLGSEPAQNLSLRAAIGRTFVTDRTPAAARASANEIALLAIAMVAAVPLAWWRRVPGASGDLTAWAAGGVIGLLLSPITWRAHLVAILPACYLLLRRWMTDRRLDAAGMAAVAAIAVPGLVLTRGVLGETVSDWSDRLSITTGALLCLLIGSAAWPFRR